MSRRESGEGAEKERTASPAQNDVTQSATKEIERLKAEIDHLHDESKSFDDSIKILENSNRQLEQRNSELESDYQTVAEKLDAETNNRETTTARKNSEIESLKHEIKNLTSERASLLQQNEEIQSEAQRSTNRYAALETSKKQVDERVKDLESQATTSTEEICRLDQESKSRLNDRNRTRRINEELEDTIKQRDKAIDDQGLQIALLQEDSNHLGKLFGILNDHFSTTTSQDAKDMDITQIEHLLSTIKNSAAASRANSPDLTRSKRRRSKVMLRQISLSEEIPDDVSDGYESDGGADASHATNRDKATNGHTADTADSTTRRGSMDSTRDALGIYRDADTRYRAGSQSSKNELGLPEVEQRFVPPSSASVNHDADSPGVKPEAYPNRAATTSIFSGLSLSDANQLSLPMLWLIVFCLVAVLFHSRLRSEEGKWLAANEMTRRAVMQIREDRDSWTRRGSWIERAIFGVERFIDFATEMPG